MEVALDLEQTLGVSEEMAIPTLHHSPPNVKRKEKKINRLRADVQIESSIINFFSNIFSIYLSQSYMSVNILSILTRKQSYVHRVTIFKYIKTRGA